MADDVKRKEKVQAGLKKLKEFQHRTGKKPAKTKAHSFENTENSTSETSVKENIQDSATHLGKNLEDLSSTESLLQITNQINELMSDSDLLLNGDLPSAISNGKSISELERRNQQLAGLFENQRQSSEQLNFHIEELKSRLSRKQKEFDKEKEELLEKAHKEQVAVKDQLQVHIQTIGILVAEKTELQSSLSQSQQTAKQKAGEVEELQGRLRASRHRLADFERESSAKATSSSQLEKSVKELTKEVDRLKLELYKIGKEKEDFQLQNFELVEKLKGKTSDRETLEEELNSVRGKLSLSELYVQQLTSHSEGQQDARKLEELFQEKIELERKFTESKETFQRMSQEKEQLSEQYQQFVSQLNRQLETIKNELQLVKKENIALQQEKSAISEMLQMNRETTSSTMKLSDELNELKQKLEASLEESGSLKNQYNSQVNDNTQLCRLTEEREARIEELESELRRRREQEVDKGQLLETMQSDKVAASRAISQNRELKKQLEELQAGFIKTSNDKLVLTEEFHHEHHINKELGERLCQQEEELHELRDQLQERERQLQQLEKSSAKDTYQQHQIVDRMRHYEAQGQLTEMLQQELTQAQERINALSDQNTQLRMSLAQQAKSAVELDKNQDDKDGEKKRDLVASLSASVRQLEMERDQLMRQMQSQQNKMDSFKSQLRDMNVNQVNVDSEVDVVSKDDYQSLRTAMSQLEDRFTSTMEQIAKLSDQKQQLEHLVTQLEGETDTIADYISLYQMQRGVMRRRAEEKDEYIAKLARDREDLKTKLSELQGLVVRLLEERKQFAPVGLDHVKPPGWAVAENGQNHIVDGVPKEMPKVAEQSEDKSGSNKSRKMDENTAKKIMDLLNDIGSSNLVERPVFDNFHPCPVCSGRLMTV